MMDVTLDLSKDFDDYIDFSEAYIKFVSSFDEIKSFRVWGVTILNEANCLSAIKSLPISNEEDLYISGWSEVEFANVVQGELSIALYEKNGEGFIKDINNEIVRIQTDWMNGIQNNFVMKEYNFQCVTTWPFGYCDLKLIGAETLQIKLNINNIISAKDYVMNTRKYGLSNRINF